MSKGVVGEEEDSENVKPRLEAAHVSTHVALFAARIHFLGLRVSVLLEAWALLLLFPFQ